MEIPTETCSPLDLCLGKDSSKEQQREHLLGILRDNDWVQRMGFQREHQTVLPMGHPMARLMGLLRDDEWVSRMGFLREH